MKTRLRLLLNALDFQTFFQHALDHFCAGIDTPFDFVQASFFNSRLSSDFSQSILAMAVGMQKSMPNPDATFIFDRLSNLIASSIMLDAVRHNIRGLSQYRIDDRELIHSVQALLIEFFLNTRRE
jgi:hypothetical protein